MTLIEAARAAASGDEAAAAELFRALHPALTRWLRVTEPRAADDLAGETWAAVAAGIGRFQGATDDDVRAWVFGIARRRVADHRRRGARRGARRHEADAALTPTPPLDPSAVVSDAMGSDAAVALVE
ncbi:MAG: sigma factor, partial [Acidimicrobiia bacterium]